MEVLWSEKYKPDSFSKLSFNSETNGQLQALTCNSDMPHLIIYGPEGSGKRTRVGCLLSQIYGKKLVTRKDVWTTKNNSTIVELTTVSSNHHTELTPSDAENNDRLALTKIIKDTASNEGLTDAKRGKFFTFVLHDGENMTHAAQAALRRTLEKYSAKIRVIIVCQSIGKIIPAIKSRCLLVRVQAPSNEQVRDALEQVAAREKVQDARAVLDTIAQASDGNLRKALLDLQAYHLTKNSAPKSFTESWKLAVREGVIEPLRRQQTPETVRAVRAVFYDLLTNQVSGDEIVREMVFGLLDHLDDAGRVKALQIGASIDAMMKQGEREVIFLESLLVKLMLLVKNK